MERQEIDYINFLEHMTRLRDSMSYRQAMKLTSYDPLGMAAVLELRRLYNGENH